MKTIIARLLIVPLIWVMMLFVIPFLIGFFWPSAAAWLEGNAALNVGSWLGIIGILLSPLFPVRFLIVANKRMQPGKAATIGTKHVGRGNP